MNIPRQVELLTSGVDLLAGMSSVDTPVVCAALRSIATKANARADELDAAMQADIAAALQPGEPQA